MSNTLDVLVLNVPANAIPNASANATERFYVVPTDAKNVPITRKEGLSPRAHTVDLATGKDIATSTLAKHGKNSPVVGLSVGIVPTEGAAAYWLCVTGSQYEPMQILPTHLPTKSITLAVKPVAAGKAKQSLGLTFSPTAKPVVLQAGKAGK